MSDYTVVMRKRTSSEVVDLAIALLRADAGAWARVYAPWAVLAAGGAALLWGVEPWLALAWAAVVGRLGQGAVTLAVSERVADRDPRVPHREALRAVGRLARASVAPVLLLLGSSFLVVLPPFVWARSLYVPEVAVVERPATGASARVGTLATAAGGNLWATRAWLVGVELWALLAGELLGQFVVDGLLELGTPFGAAWEGEVTPWVIAGEILVQPLLALVRFCAWLDVRTRSEGLDAWFALWRASHRGRAA